MSWSLNLLINVGWHCSLLSSSHLIEVLRIWKLIDHFFIYYLGDQRIDLSKQALTSASVSAYFFTVPLHFTSNTEPASNSFFQLTKFSLSWSWFVKTQVRAHSYYFICLSALSFVLKSAITQDAPQWWMGCIHHGQCQNTLQCRRNSLLLCKTSPQ